MIEKLQANYRRALIGKVKRLEDLAQEYRHGRLEALDDILLLTHSLKGSGTTFGYPAVSDAASRVKSGTPDEVMLQVAQLLDTMSQTAAQGGTGKTSRKILVIEDDTDISILLDTLLTRSLPGYEVLVADTAKIAMEFLASQTFALVVLNLGLPDGDGRALLKHIREWYSSELPVVVLSASDTESTHAECLALGARSFFKKPFNPPQLAAAIKDELQFSQLPETALPLDPEAARPTEFKGKRVLLAEDDVLLAGIVVHRLEREGIHVDLVQDGATALQSLIDKHYDLAILDVKMPIMDGFEVLQEFRKRNTHMRVILLTAMSSENDVVRGFALGADHYVVKPFSPAELLARVKSLLKSSGPRTVL
ncbi:MAG: response regulator transcription factor [Pseudohongiella sp.]|nr:response regulator transcription factor [Pseudohongiella sp.]